jgi:hypothetical protein
MTDEKKPTFVTRAELYPILGIVYLLIAFALVGLLRSDDDNILLIIAHLGLFGVALASSVTFGILSIRERRRRTGERSDLPESRAPADRPRD